MKIKEIECKSALSKCGFPGGGLSINPYVGCSHSCEYCYARFMKRFTGHTEKWGSFIDVRVNIADVLREQIKSEKFRGQPIHMATVTDPYQPCEKKYQLTRKILEVLVDYDNELSILTKSDLILRDIDLLKRFKKININFTVNTLDEEWGKHIEPSSSSVKERLEAMKKISSEGAPVFAMMGPCWPIFTNITALFKEFKKAGVKHVFSESFNATGNNWIGVEKVLREHYPDSLKEIRETFFNKERFYFFYNKAQNEIKEASKEYNIPATVYFGLKHAAKFK